jgi:hypothetical protein
MSSNRYRANGFHRRRAPLIVVFVIPAVLCAAAVKSARASFYKLQPIVSDGVDDDSGAPIPCALPEQMTKELSSTKARPHALANAVCPSASRSRITLARSRRPISFAEPPLRLKQLLSRRAGSSADPEAPH